MSGSSAGNDVSSRDIAAKRPIRFDPGEPSDPVAQTTTTQRYLDPTGAFKAGFWSGEPGRSEVHYRKDEFCVLLAGVVRLTDEEGHAQTYRAGDTFLIPNGSRVSGRRWSPRVNSTRSIRLRLRRDAPAGEHPGRERKCRS